LIPECKKSARRLPRSGTGRRLAPAKEELMTRYLVLLLSVLLVLSCAKKEPATSDTVASAPATTSSAATTSSVPASTPAAAPPAAATTSSGIASADGEKPGTRVDVAELKRGSGGTVTLRMAFVNDSES